MTTKRPVGRASVRLMLLLGGSLLSGTGAMAQSSLPASSASKAEPAAIGDIIVTANRRAERLQDVPMSINVLSNDNLKAAGVADSQALAALVPGLSLTKTNSTQYYLRGVGTADTSNNANQSVSSYLDGVFVYSTYGSLPLANVERVEVLRGPQGTLFGRNTTGGAIQAVTRDPLAKPSLNASLGYGNYNTLTATFYGNTHVTDNLGISLAGEFQNQGDGYGRNTVRNTDDYFRDDWSIQAKVAYEPTDRTTITGFFQYRRTKDSGLNYVPINGTSGIDGVDGSSYGRFETRSGGPSSALIHDYLAYGKIEQSVGEFAKLTSITSYRHLRTYVPLDQDGTPIKAVDAILQDAYRNFSQELQLSSVGSGPLTWTAGVFYFTSSAGYDPITIDAPPVFVRMFHRQTTRSLAGYGQATYQILHGTKLTAGLRYSHEKEKLPSDNYTLVGPDPNPIRLPFQPDTLDSSGWTWRLAIDQEITDEIKGYVSYNRGMKSGGFPLVTAANLPAYKPEKLDAYEAGLKMEFLNGRIRLNPSFFLYKFKNIQVSVIQSGVAFVQNAAAATIKGVDLDAAIRVSDRLQLNGAFEYLDTRFDHFNNAIYFVANPVAIGGATQLSGQDATGNHLPYAPKTSGSAGFSYTAPLADGNLRLDGTVRYVAKQYASASNLYALPAYALVNAGLGWSSPGDKYSVRLFANNLFDKRYRAQIFESVFGIYRMEGAPRTYGVTLGVKM